MLVTLCKEHPGSAQQEHILLYPQAAPGREFLESYIHHRYQQFYGAQLSVFAPFLFACWQGRYLRAVLGLQPAASGPLLIETYLQKPIEEITSTLTGTVVQRDQIIEIGNLAGNNGGSQLLFILLTELLYQAGYTWVSFTATAQVSSLLRRLGFSPVKLGNADPAKLGTAANKWGTYYEGKPAVLLGDIVDARRILQQNEFTSKVLATHQAMIDRAVSELKRGVERGVER
ncbi:MAG: thermostable hemolysin [Pseudomonadales bacterium]|nr:thermostable hemolysin [Pseudomonadales bacterium]